MVDLSASLNERMFERWRPSGDGPIRVVKVVPGVDPLIDALAAVDELSPS